MDDESFFMGFVVKNYDVHNLLTSFLQIYPISAKTFNNCY